MILRHIGNLPEYTKKISPGRPKIPLEKVLLMTLWHLGNQESLRSIADRFGVTESSVYACIRKLCKTIVNHLSAKFIQWPTLSQERFQRTTAGFEYGLAMSGRIGCRDCTHIHMKAPQVQEGAYVNRNGFHSLILQCVCDHQRRFTDVFCGCTGSTHDASVYNEVVHNREKFFPGEHYIIGDQAYPLNNWLIKKYQDNDRLSENERRFNKHLSVKRQLIEEAFGILKGRFRKLKMLDIDIIEDIPEIEITACTLHNICC